MKPEEFVAKYQAEGYEVAFGSGYIAAFLKGPPYTEVAKMDYPGAASVAMAILRKMTGTAPAASEALSDSQSSHVRQSSTVTTE